MNPDQPPSGTGPCVLTCGLVLCIAMGTLIAAAGSALPSPVPAEAARKLVRRVLPSHAGQFEFETIPAENGSDVFEVEGRGSRVVIRGNSGVSMAVGLQWYLERHGFGRLSWFGSGLLEPSSVEPVRSKVRRVAWARHRYFLNYVIFTYSLPWWDWDQWERLIDWMALNGVNRPLSITGQEAVWGALGPKLGLSQAQMKAFLPGPAYLPFGWMGTLDGWGGPLPATWIDRHRELEKKILARERELGMTPVLQGFTGHVPSALADEFPQIKLHQIEWVDWTTSVLDPREPLFRKIARLFMEEQSRLYGSDHLYAADTFIEMTPPGDDPEFLPSLSRAIYQGMKGTDPEAVWVLQDWTFHNQREFWMEAGRIRRFLDPIPDDRLLVLHMFSESRPTWNLTQAFYGKYWVWGVVQNFGDMVQLGGPVRTINNDLQTARDDPLGCRLSGVGVINEGLGYNPAVASILFQMAWLDPSRVNLSNWFKEYSRHRYGRAHAEAEKAWLVLQETAYAAPCPALGRSALLEVPVLSPRVESEPEKRKLREIPYDNRRLARAWQHLLAASDHLGEVDAYRYDLVNVARQVLSNHAAALRLEVRAAFEQGSLDRFERASERFLTLGRDVDELVGTRPEFLLGRWLEDAKRWGATRAERAALEWNARRVLTLWGAGMADAFPRDYARKEWSGMISDFYLKRWEAYLDALGLALKEGRTFDEAAFQKELLEWEREWAHRRDTYPTKPRGDSVSMARRLWAKYNGEL